MEVMSKGEELYIVLIPDKEQIESVIKLQKAVSDYYKMYKDDLYPQLHITIDRIEEKDLQRAEKIIDNVVKISGPVKLNFDKFSCFYLADDRHFVLKITGSDSLTAFAQNIHQRLEKENISTVDNYEDWIFHITLVNNKFADNPIPLNKFDDLCIFIEGQKQSSEAYAHRLEIWYPTLDPERKCIKSYTLQKRGDKN